MKLQENVSLAPYTSFHTGGPASHFAAVDSIDELRAVLHEAPEPFWVLGSGANVLISDRGLKGTVVHLCAQNIETAQEHNKTFLIADAGTDWDSLVVRSLELGKWGLERMSGIPGTVGAAVVGNIAAYGQAVSDSLQWVEVIDSSNPELKIQRIAADQLDFGYRYSKFQSEDFRSLIIIRAAFSLSDTAKPLEYASALKIADELRLNPDDLHERRNIILEARQIAGSLLDDTHRSRTAGSFFRNPEVSQELADAIMKFEEKPIDPKDIRNQNRIHGGSTTRVSAAHVLLAAGFTRGQTWGNVRLHPDHILKIENFNNATSQEIYNVVQLIVHTVGEKLGIELVPEVRIIGDFSES